MMSTLTRLEPLKGSPRAATRIALGVAVVLGILLSGNAYAYAPIKAQIQIKQITPKMYAKSKLPLSQYKCALELYTRESNWRPNAKNGTHYGIPQGHTPYLKNASPIAQVEWGIRYVRNRYGTMCNALHHFNNKGWH
jgi:hypothetical protein